VSVKHAAVPKLTVLKFDRRADAEGDMAGEAQMKTGKTALQHWFCRVQASERRRQ
jgi:hypothetical protein